MNVKQCRRCHLFVDPQAHTCATSSGRPVDPAERALRSIVKVLGPAAPACEGCRFEISEALQIATDALKDLA